MQRLLEKAEPLSSAEMAEQLAIHANSARFHLDALVELGYAERSAVSQGGRGRPRIRYSATAAAPDVSHDHWHKLLTTFVERFVLVLPDSMAQAEDAGVTWGASLASDDDGQPIQGLVEHAASIGFTSTVTPDGLIVERCPYRICEPETLDAICAVHLGMVKGYLQASGANVEPSRLQRGDQACAFTLTPRRDVDPVPQRGDHDDGYATASAQNCGGGESPEDGDGQLGIADTS